MTDGVVTGGRLSGTNVVDSASGPYYLNPKLITRPRMTVRGVFPEAKSEEIATLVVKGLTYEDWETVWYQWTLGDPYPQFRFTATEDDPHLPNSRLLQFLPGDECELYLGGYPIMKGVIEIRQVSYDKNNHGIVLQGVGLTWYAANASVISEKSEWEGTFEEIAEQVLAPTCSKGKVWGKIDQTPFKPPVRNEQGEAIFHFLERLGRDRKVVVTSDPYGDFIFIGEHKGAYVGDLIEGENILKCSAIISSLKARTDFITTGSVSGSDEKNMRAAAEQKASVQGSAKCYNPLLTPVEHPVWTRHELELRALHERMFAELQTKIEVTVTVQGWFNSRSGLRWDVGQVVVLNSPMTGVPLKSTLKIRTVTYTQDANGSLTTMVLVDPSGFNDTGFITTGPISGMDQEFDPFSKATTVSDAPAANPPVQTPHSEG